MTLAPLDARPSGTVHDLPGDKDSLEVCEFGRNHREAVRTRDDASSTRQGRDEVHMCADEPDRFETRDSLTARRASDRTFQRIFGVGVDLLLRRLNSFRRW